MTAPPPDDTTTDLHAVIAAIRAERDEALAREAALTEELAARTSELALRTTELATRNSEFGERIEHQVATIDVLKAMSSSPGDAQPVFDLIARQAAKLCSVPTAAVATFDGTMIHLATQSGFDAAYADAYVSQFPRPVGLDSSMGRAILHRRVDRVEDITTDPGHSFAGVLGHWSVMAVPILRDGVPLGAITIGRPAMGPFSDIQLTMLQTFAEQAVIAITSAETYRALQSRTSDLQESLEYQTATSDVLKVISQSTFDLQPVLDTLVETAAQLCDAEQALISLREGELARLVANFGFPPEYETYTKALGPFPIDPDSPTVAQQALGSGRLVHVHDVAAVPGYWEIAVRLGKQRTTLGVPLLREGQPIGVILLARQRVEPFTDRQIELVSTFANQAVIAIENTRLVTEQREALEQQTATTEVLQVINASPGNLTPVFEAILEKAHNLCDVAVGSLSIYVNGVVHTAATRGFSEEYQALLRPPYPAIGSHQALMRGGHSIQTPDFRTVPVSLEMASSFDHLERMNLRTGLWVPLRKDGTALGCISSYRDKVQPFSEKEIALLENFAAQAVIAMDNARLITETREALEQQTATAEVLQVINASPGDLTPVFDAMLEKGVRLCDAQFGFLHTYDGEFFRAAAMRGVAPALANVNREPMRPGPGGAFGRLTNGEDIVHISDITSTASYQSNPLRQAFADQGGARTALWVALRKDGMLLGTFVIFRQEVRPFSDKQIALLKNFAAQAVIAMESARLLNELRSRTDELAQRQAELRVTFENMGDGVAMFDETQHLVAWNRKFQDILDVPDAIIARRQTYSEYVHYLAERGEYGPEADPEAHVRGLIERAGQPRTYERIRPDGRMIEIRHNPVPDGGFVLIYADITERKRNEAEIRAARDAAEEASRTIEAAYRDLKAAQANLIQAEKMASLGQLTAGIAHEIKNPLNFVNNFAALSVDLLSELKETAAPGFAALSDDQRADIEDVSAMLTSNLEKITEHGKRADGIVKAMLEHSRGSSAERRMVDLNVLIDEALNLAYHGARAQDQSFNITLERDFGEDIASIEVNPQDMTRVFLNIFSNGFYAATRRARNSGDVGFVPMLKVATLQAGEAVEIRVRDNGTGIPGEIRDKLFQPFFTTKPTGEGTGLGLSITYDIVTKQHGGAIAVDSEVNEFTEFIVTLPRQMSANDGDRA